MLTLAGEVCNNLGEATKNLRTQLPLIANTFPEVAIAHAGTINILLDQGLLVKKPDHVTPRLNWHPAHAPGEIFHLLRIQLELPIGGPFVSAWLYIPQNSPHRKNIRLHEVLAPWIAIGKAPQRARIHIDRPPLESASQQHCIVV